MDSKAKSRSARRALTLGLLVLCLAAWTLASSGRYSFRIYENPDGLKDLVIRDLLRDRAGFLWIATHTGLYRFDGREFRHYTTRDGLADNWITNLAENADGGLWAVTLKGLCRRAGNRFETVLAERPWLRFRPNTGTPLAADKEGNLFFSTNDGLFAVWRHTAGDAAPMAPPVRFERLGETDGEFSTTSGLFVDREGAVWYTAPGGVLVRRLARDGRRVEVDSSLPPEVWVSVLEDRKGGIWLAGVSGSVYARPPGSRRFRRMPVVFSGRGRMSVTRGNEILIPASSGFSVVEGYGAKAEKIEAASGLPGEVIECFLEDDDGALWIGSVGTGLIRWMGGRAWRQWRLGDGLPGNFVTQISRAPDGTEWVSTLKGLVKFAPPEGEGDGPPLPGDGKGRLWLTPRQVPLRSDLGKTPAVYAVGAGLQGEVWLSLTPGSVHVLEPGTGKLAQYGAARGFLLGIVCQYLAHDGAVWIAHTKGLGRVRESDGKRVYERIWPSDGEANVYRLGTDSKGAIWAATSRGLLRVDSQGMRLFDRRNGLQQDDVFGLSVALDDSIWIHYRLSLGVSHVMTDAPELRVRHYREAQGLASDKVLSIATDAKRRVWVGTEFGLSVLNGDPPWITFNRDHGLVWDDCSFAALEADPDGAIWVGTSRGLSRFEAPDRIARAVPPVAFTALRSGGVLEEAVTPGVRVKTSEELRISYAALRFSNQSAIRFRYRLVEDGAAGSAGWVATRDREVNFARLSPGLHRFEVEASEGGGLWSQASAIEILVPTPWWRQWWAIGLMIWAVLALLRVMWKWRYRRMIHRQNQLESAVGERTRELEVQRERAEAASRFKDQILANVSHEIRTPLNGIVGFASLMLESKLDDDQRDQLRTVYASGKSLVDIIEDLLDFASIEAGDLKFEETAISLTEVVDQTTRTLRYEADRQGLEFHSHCAQDIPALLLGDGHRVRQILLNLLGNAIKFTEAGSVELRVRCARTPGDAATFPTLGEGEPERVWIEFEVSDTGIGISAAHLEQVFDPFRQLDGSSRRVYGGTGLGLATVRRIVDGMGGRIRVASEPGRGSTFCVEVPLKIPSASPEEPLAVTQTAPKSDVPAIRRVLIAEDNPVNQKLLHRILAKRGLEMVTVADGKAATDAVASEPFDLILMDIQMPVMDGIQATRLIRERERESGSRRIPVIAVTANGMFQCREECAAVGMDGYVVKPFGPANLFDAIDNVHRRIADATGISETETTISAEISAERRTANGEAGRGPRCN